MADSAQTRTFAKWTPYQKPVEVGSRGFSLVAKLSLESQRHFAEIAEGIIASTRPEIARALRREGSSAAHVTLVGAISCASADATQNEIMFEQAQPVYNVALTNIAQRTAPFDIHFNTTQVNSDCVILLATDPSGTMDRIRRTFVNGLPGKIPDAISRPRLKDIIHSTVVRFNSTFDLSELQTDIAKHSVSFTERVDAIQMIRGDTWYMEHHQVMNNYLLQG